MIRYDDIKIIRTDIEKGSFNKKKNKYVEYKKPIVKTKILELNDSCFDLGELYSMLKHHAEQNVYCDELKVEFTFKLEL